MPNTFGSVVRDFTKFDFVARRSSSTDYVVEHIIQRVQQKNEIIFGSLLNYVQYFAEIGGFDALLALFKMGTDVVQDTASNAGSSAGEPSTVKLPFRFMNSLLMSFTHLEHVLTEDFSAKFTTIVK